VLSFRATVLFSLCVHLFSIHVVCSHIIYLCTYLLLNRNLYSNLLFNLTILIPIPLTSWVYLVLYSCKYVMIFSPRLHALDFIIIGFSVCIKPLLSFFFWYLYFVIFPFLGTLRHRVMLILVSLTVNNFMYIHYCILQAIL